jgi:hypothetical protein
LALFDRGNRQIGRIIHPSWEGFAEWGRRRHRVPLSGINRTRGDDDVVWYNPLCHRTTLTYPGGTELVAAGGRVVRVRQGYGDSVIPPTGGVLSFSPERWEALPPRALPEVGDPIRVVARLMENGSDVLRSASAVVNGRPALVQRGRPVDAAVWHDERDLSESFTIKKHPRTAIGWAADGTWILVVVDGRQEEISMGINLPDLAQWMTELGAVEAMNLDGGGSSTLVVGSEVLNHPSDGSERLVSDAILVMPR